MRKNVVIIGGGIGGLAAGCYLRRNGYSTRIIEMGRECGGVSVPWNRGEYCFDGATNWLPGSSPGINIHDLIAELIDFADGTVDEFDEFMRIEDGDEAFRVYTDLHKLKKEMLRIAPEDEGVITEFIDAVLHLSRLNIPFDQSPDLMSFPELVLFPVRNARMILFFLKWKKMTIREFAARFTNSRMRAMIQQILPHHEFFSLLALMMPLSWLHCKSAGYPHGGSRSFIDRLAAVYRDAGGEIILNTRVTGLCTDRDTATGVMCADGSRYDADIVISAADRYETIVNLCGGRYMNPAIKKQFRSYRVFPAMLQISLGIARTFDNEPHKMVIPFAAPLALGNDTEKTLLLRICNFDDCFAPEGKTALVVHLRTHDWQYWVDLRNNDRKRYENEKVRVSGAVIDTLDKRFGGIRDACEVSDVATPATYMRYTNVWKGSYQGWAPTPAVIGRSLKRTLPGLKNFYCTGQWLSPAGGLPRVIVLGRQVAQRICKDDGKAFIAR
ncbi:MAG: FAD-dependent oxidoreductase [Chitinivibrionales bacterium]|nr:FAD-dependent oxidoreductase [Chitinivibrionales bacterium]